MGRGYAHLAEENVGKLFVVVLTGMNEDGLDLRMALLSWMSGAIFGRLGRAPTIFRIFRRWLTGYSKTGIEIQYSTGVLGIRQGLIAVRTKKVLVQCWRVRFPEKTP